MTLTDFHPLQAALSSSLLFLLVPAYADVSTVLYTGLTHTNNLEVQAGNDIRLNDQGSLSRNGLETGLLLNKQSLDYNGGYLLEANATFNKDLSANNNNISRASLAASKLSALSPDWLARNTIAANWYENDALPSNNYKGLSLNSTLGYLNNNGGGTDLSLSLRQEQHDAVSTDRYDIFRSSIQLTHYLPHKKEAAYWGLRTRLRNNNANDNSRDYYSFMLGVTRHQFSLGSFTGQVGLSWQHDDYEQPTSLTMLNPLPASNMPSMPPATSMPQGTGATTTEKRKDNLYYLSLQLGKPLTPSLSVQFSASLGRYDSSISDQADTFYSSSIKFAWKL